MRCHIGSNICKNTEDFVKLLIENISTAKRNKFPFIFVMRPITVSIIYSIFHNKRKFLNMCAAYRESFLLNLILCIRSLCIVLSDRRVCPVCGLSHCQPVSLYIPVYSHVLIVCVSLNMVSNLFVSNALFVFVLFNTFEIIRM